MNNTYLLPLFLSGIAIIILLIAFTVIMVLIQKQKQNRYAREKQHAEMMKVSPRTLDGYKDSLFTKLNIHSRTGLAIFAARIGIVPLTSEG